MRLHTLFAGLFLAGIVLGNTGKTWSNDRFPGPGSSGSNAAEERITDLATDDSAQQESRGEPFDLAAVDYCYRGSTVDPTTGETVDLYTLCTDEAKGNMDLA